MNRNDYVIGIGAANVDIFGKSSVPIKIKFDHIANIRTQIGGVTRNILDNLSALGINTKLLSALGDDLFGEAIINNSKERNIDMSDVLRVEGSSSGIFMQVMDDNNDMFLALCDMSVIKKVDIEYLKSHDAVIRQAKVIVFDPSLEPEVIEYLIDAYKEIPLFLDPVSDDYALKIKPYVSRLFCVKPNQRELGVLADMPIETVDDCIKASQSLINKGLKSIYVSLGKEGALYCDKDTCLHKKLFEESDVVNASGAGDGFFAGAIYGYLNDLGIEKTMDIALAAGIANIRSEKNINPKLSMDYINEILKS